MKYSDYEKNHRSVNEIFKFKQYAESLKSYNIYFLNQYTIRLLIIPLRLLIPDFQKSNKSQNEIFKIDRSRWINKSRI
ncbi:hypothetical protein VNO80_01222 [Phaseolus coccineus]|uniref:Uncharacterized protein n=1 Tax=Phaseolus coccineus TaxID=3886 RepID=A0AAN9RQT1_PHACN